MDGILVSTLITQLLIAVPSIIASTLAVTTALNGALHIENHIAKQIVSWIVAVATGCVFALTGGLTVSTNMTYNLIAGAGFGIIAGLDANEIYTWGKIEAFLKKVQAWFSLLTTSKKK